MMARSCKPNAGEIKGGSFLWLVIEVRFGEFSDSH